MSFYGCISVKPAGGGGWYLYCRSAYWWERSPNYNNANNFCNVNNSGNANNNSANNSLGLAPDFVSQKWYGSNIVVKAKHDPYERRNTSRDESPKLFSDTFARTPLGQPACMAGEVPYPVSCVRVKQIRRHPTRYLYGGRILL